MAFVGDTPTQGQSRVIKIVHHCCVFGDLDTYLTWVDHVTTKQGKSIIYLQDRLFCHQIEICKNYLF